MKALEKLEQKKEVWFLLYFIIVFFLLRLPSLIEPLWYGDEGIYQVIGMALNNGKILYSQIWDNKPPLLYIIYALAGSDQFTVRLLSLISGAVSLIPFYYLSKKLFNTHKMSVITTAIYIFLLGTPFIEGNIANAENFMLLPIVLSGLLLYGALGIKHTPFGNLEVYKKLYVSGLFLGIALLLKTVAFFDFAAFLTFLVISLGKAKFLWKKIVYYCVGFLLPLFVTGIYFLFQNAFADFIRAVFLGNISYVGYANELLVPQGWLYIKLLALVLAIGAVMFNRKKLSSEDIFIYLWFIFSLSSAVFSGRPWPHYLLMAVPAASLMAGLVIEQKSANKKIVPFGFLLILVVLSASLFKLNTGSFGGLWSYYKNFGLFITDNKSIESYQKYFDKNVPRDYEVAQFIISKAKKDEGIFVWGNNPQIYVLANKIPPGKYSVEYHISQDKDGVKETVEDIKRIKPKYIIALPEVREFQFITKDYINKYKLGGALIYERIF
jgi:4-amino-4-deoxy-L-arabinose transferase-like glycosyltransferase